jgi:transposase
MGRFGGTELSRNTLAASVVRVGQATQPVINLLRDALLDSFIVHGDETEVQVLKEPGRKAQAKSYMWVQMNQASGADGTGPPIRLFGYSPSRSTHSARTLYEGMRPGGVLMSDGYEPYAAIAEQHRLVHLGCWAHCRRYFNDALQAMPKDKRGPEQLPAQFIELIGRLYKVEADARRDQLDAQALQQRRTQHSKPVLEQIEALALQHLHGVLPGSLLGKALHYVTAQWPKLVRYVDDGRYPIDNNACENAIRPFVVGRRNWLFADTVGGANASANLYSLLQTCVANGIDGYRYLRRCWLRCPRPRPSRTSRPCCPGALPRPIADQQPPRGARTRLIDRLPFVSRGRLLSRLPELTRHSPYRSNLCSSTLAVTRRWCLRLRSPPGRQSLSSVTVFVLASCRPSCTALAPDPARR